MVNPKTAKYILAIETSCDETAASIVSAQKTKNGYEFDVLSNVVASQIDLHKKWGGVWPELASRAHLEAMIPVLEESLSPLMRHPGLDPGSRSSGLRIKSAMTCIDAIAVTTGPGLIGSLLMGVETAQILGAYFNKSVIEVNHLEGHIYASFLGGKLKSQKSKVKTTTQSSKLNNLFEIQNSLFKIPNTEIFPILALVVSGGHTSLIMMNKHLNYRTVGQTIDDAAGEAFDKVARILGLGYPGGPAIEKFAKGGDENAYKLPLSMLNSKDLNFSFSGLKTAVLYLTKNPATGDKRPFDKRNLAASFQKTVAEILTKKTIQAIKKYNPKTVILSGGVSANEYLREYFVREISQLTTCPELGRRANDRQPTVLVPPKNLSTDNALGIAIAGAVKFLNNKQTTWDKIFARTNFLIDQS